MRETTKFCHNNVSRRDILRVGLQGCTIASIGFGFMAAGGTMSLAETVESEADKKAAADHVLSMGLGATLNQFPGRVGTPHMIWAHGTPELKAAIERLSNGKIYVEIHDGGALGGQITLLKKVQQGAIQAGSCTTQNAAQLVPLLNVLDVPYAIGAKDENFWRLLFSKEFNDIFRAAGEERRLTLAVSFPWRRRMMLSRNVDQDVRLPEQLAGMKIRVTASKFEQLAFEVLPSSAVPIAWSETYSALKDGVMEGMHIAPGSGFDVGMAPVIGQILDTEWMYNTDSYWFSTRWLDDLPGDLKDAVMQASLEVQTSIYDNYQLILRETYGLAKDSPSSAGYLGAGTRVNFLTDDERAAWQNVLSPENNGNIDAAIDEYGRDAYEVLREVAAGDGDTTPRAWWNV
ncbi:TRAP transporter substrate-binding protein [Leisingera daeponensis]|uniref:TRAP transporter substrate-binding protein n=1 Tax=Leisingera daeponensis TaxID=405746 RepID=UPI001C9822CE|nr:TRAP transporter substrate-binding protein [Leisingera daeponensis]MBY6059397.1 TRAP transporter substrate-binding protein [Leisingera daeponensis]